MRLLASYLTNFTAPSGGYSIGQLKDDPGDSTGSGIVVATHNDLLYAFVSIIIKYVGSLSDTAESETASDFFDAVEIAIGIQNENVSEYDNSTTYAQDDHVMYLGAQYVSMVSSNTGNPPFDNLDKWMPCFNRDEAIREWREGRDIDGGFNPMHDIRDVTNYREFWKWGKYNYGGDSGRNFQGYGVHLAGQILTGDSDYEAIFQIGLSDEYHLLDIIAPDILSVRTLIDSEGRVPRIVDGAGGDTEDVGGVQDDQSHGHDHQIGVASAGAGIDVAYQKGSAHTVRAWNAPFASASEASSTAVMISDGTNGIPKMGDETRMKNYSVGLKSLLVMVEI